MVFRQRAGRKTFRGRRRGRRTAYAVAKRALRAVRSVRPELQYLYTNEGDVTPGTSGLLYHTTALAQGSGDSERKAAMVMAKSLQLNLAMIKNSSATTDFVRVVIFMDKQQIADTTTQGPSFTYLSPITPTDKMRFRILYDRMFSLSDSTVSRHIRIIKRINAFVRYNGTASTDIQKNGVYVRIVGKDNTNKAECTLNWRLTYTDA